MQIINASKYSAMDGTERVHPENSEAFFSVAAEHFMDVFLNEQRAMQVVCTPQHLDELVVGRLITEGLVSSTEDIETLYICDRGLRARVMLRPGAETQLSKAEGVTVSTCCTDNRTLMESRNGALTPVSPIPWDKEWVLEALGRMRREEPLYEQTHAVHSCFLVRAGRVLCCREDIGRHNALDKAVGWACINGIDLKECLLFTTGRMPSDMVTKAVRCGVPILASKTYPTDQGIAVAKENRLTLITLRPGGEWILWNDGTKAPEGDNHD